MKRIAPLSTGDFTPLDSDVYTGTIQRIDVVQRPADTYNPEAYEQFEFTWDIDDEDTTLKWWAKISVHEKSNIATKLLPALGLPQVAPGAEWDEQDWVGMSCQLQVEKFAKSDGRESNKITGFMKLPKRARAPQPKRELVAVGAGDEDDDTAF